MLYVCDKYVITCLVLYHALVSRPDLAISALVHRTRADIAKSGPDTGRDTEQDMCNDRTSNIDVLMVHSVGDV